MVKPYETILVTVDRDNFENVRAMDEQAGYDALQYASDTYNELSSGIDNWARFQNDSRGLEFVGKTPLDIKNRCNIELEEIQNKIQDAFRQGKSASSVESTLSPQLVADAVGIITNKHPNVKNAISWLSQQVGNNVYFASAKTLASTNPDFIFDLNCAGVNGKNTLEISGAPFYEAKKKAETSFYYFRAKDGSGRVLYLDQNGAQKIGQKKDVDNLIKQGKGIPLMTVAAEASIRANSEGEPIVTTQHSYHYQPEYVKWSGPDYPKMQKSLPSPKMVLHDADVRIKQMASISELSMILESDFPDHQNNLHHDFELMHSLIPNLNELFNKAQMLQRKYETAGAIRRRLMEPELNMAIIALQDGLRKAEQSYHYSLDDLRKLDNSVLKEKLVKPTEAKAAASDNRENIAPNPELLSSKKIHDERNKSTNELPAKRERPLKDITQSESKKPRNQ